MTRSFNLTRQGIAAFTLIESLVVISIIALLISILLPALQSARTSAQSISSLSNIRQIALATHLYAQDEKGFLPAEVSNGSPANMQYFPAKLTGVATGGVVTRTGYLADPSVFWSPGRMAYGGATRSTIDWAYPGYAANRHGAMPREADGKETANLDRPGSRSLSKLLLMAEAFRGNQFPAVDGRTQLDNVAVLFAYNGAVVRSYADAHAIATDPTDLYWQTTGPRSGVWLVSSRSNLLPYVWP